MIENLKIITATLAFVGIVLSFLDRWYAPDALVTESSPYRPRWVGWFSWGVTSVSAILYIVLDHFVPLMRLLRRLSLLVAFSLLTSAATAYAERAWVLWSWSQWDEKQGKSWDMEGVWTDREGCLRQLGVHKQAAEMAGDMFTDHPSMLTVISGVPQGEKPGRLWGNKFDFRCLPDTVDPRGPKGK